MNVVLLILKIIGIVLLCILGLLLAVILLILFCPFRYRLDGKKEEALEGRARVTWLLHFLVAEVSYVKKLNIRIKILGIPFYDRLRKKAKEAKKAEKEKEEEEAFEDEAAEEAESGSEAEDVNRASDEEHTAEAAEDENDAAAFGEDKSEGISEEAAEELTDENAKEASDGKDGGGKKRGPKKSFGDRLDEAADVIEDGFEELEDMLDETADSAEEGIEKLRSKIESIADTIAYYRRILESDGALWVFDYVVKHIKGCLNNVAPRRIDFSISFTNDDPASIAEVWKVYAIVVTLLGNIRGKRELNTLQDENSISFKAGIKGRATAVVLGFHGLCLLLNRKVKKFIKLMKREDKADGRK
ncbi:MAG: hypothetical protein K5686_08695 [Lachnospiraceae bacterium]|nr:hypothetical protein [Lachnospiraceae bacterium]